MCVHVCMYMHICVCGYMHIMWRPKVDVRLYDHSSTSLLNWGLSIKPGASLVSQLALGIPFPPLAARIREGPPHPPNIYWDLGI